MIFSLPLPLKKKCPMCLGFAKKKERERKSEGKKIRILWALFPPFFSPFLSFACPLERTTRNAPQQKTTRRDIMFAAQSTSFTGAKVVAAKSAKTTRRCVFFFFSAEWFSALVCVHFCALNWSLSLSDGMMVRISSRPEQSARARLFSPHFVAVA